MKQLQAIAILFFLHSVQLTAIEKNDVIEAVTNLKTACGTPNFAKSTAASRALFCSLVHRVLATFSASKA